MEFGEVVLFRTALDKSSSHKADEYWFEGVFLGIETEASEFWVTTGKVVYKCSHHSVRRVVAEKNYGANYMDNVTASVDEYLQKV